VTGIDLFGEPATSRKAMGSHQRSTDGTDAWLTPPDLLTRLGPFDLDPCAALDQPWPTAAKHFTAADDGLRQAWAGRVWLNPPYSRTGPWLSRLAEHGNGTALLFARTDTKTFHAQVWRRAVALLFLAGRLNFHHPDGRRATANAGAPSVLVAYSWADAARLAALTELGAFVPLARTGAS
jgi:phage N-6-adenine-methyltransferase